MLSFIADLLLILFATVMARRVGRSLFEGK
jgi:hypothetical protein